MGGGGGCPEEKPVTNTPINKYFLRMLTWLTACVDVIDIESDTSSSVGEIS